MRLLTLGTEYESFLSDESFLRGSAELIFFPKTAEELSEALKAAGKRNLSVTVQGSRTGLVGGAVPESGLVINLTQMDGTPVSYEEGGRHFLHVPAGTTLERINSAAASFGCFFPPDPTEASATIGGLYASGAAGPSSLLYGSSSAYFRALRWVTPAGDIWDIARGRFVFDEAGCPMPDGRKLCLSALSSPSPIGSCIPRKGEDLIDFLAGSEGKLGVAAGFTLCLLPLPAAKWGVLFFFPDDNSVFSFAASLEPLHKPGSDAALVCAEYFDSGALRLLSSVKGQNFSLKGMPDFPPDSSSAVYTELSGNDEDKLEAVLSGLLDIFIKAGGREADAWAEQGAAAVCRLRALRHALPEATANFQSFLNPDGSRPLRLETDFTGPKEKFADYIRMYRDDMEDAGFEGIVYGDILENRLHTSFFFDSQKRRGDAEALIARWALRTAEDGGLIASENGIGKLKTGLINTLLPGCVKDSREKIRDFFDPERRLV